MHRAKSSAGSRRTKKQCRQPTCNFTTNPSQTIVEKVVSSPIPTITPNTHPLPNEPTPTLAPSPNETIMRNHEEIHFEHDLEEEQHAEQHADEDHINEEHHEGDVPSNEGSPTDSSIIQHQKILIGVDMSIKDFDPRKPVYAKMTEIIHGHFDGPWTSIRRVPVNTKTMWFEEFEKSFCWTVSNALMKKVFLFQAGKHLSNVLKPYFKSKITPYFVREAIWQRMLALKRTDVGMLKQSEANKKNRNSKKSTGKGPYRGGSRKVKKWVQVMEKEKGSRPMISEVVKKLWSKDKDGIEIAPDTATYVVNVRSWKAHGNTLDQDANFEQLCAELPSSEPISKATEMKLWLKATDGVHNNRVFGFGEEGVGLVRDGLIDNLDRVPCSSTSYAEDYIQPFKEEIREVRDEIKNLQSQNKMLTDMLEKLLHHVQRGFAPSK